jgi:hypothetical protein
MKTLTKGNLVATINGNKVSVEDYNKSIEVVYDYPIHQTEQSALEHCIWKYEQKRSEFLIGLHGNGLPK